VFLRSDNTITAEKLKALDGIETVALTTNAVTLSRHLPSLVSAGLDNVNISLDTLVPQKFAFIGRRPGNLHFNISFYKKNFLIKQ